MADDASRIGQQADQIAACEPDVEEVLKSLNKLYEKCITVKLAFASDWFGGSGGGRFCATASNQLAQGNLPGSELKTFLQLLSTCCNITVVNRTLHHLFLKTRGEKFMNSCKTPNGIVWFEHVRCNNCLVATMGLLAAYPQASCKSELR